MEIALYEKSHDLPWGKDPKNPYTLLSQLEKTGLKEWVIIEAGETVSFPDSMTMRLLKGLRETDLPVMAHISLVFDQERQSVSYPDQCWIGVTTNPSSLDVKGLPIVVKNRELTVLVIWGQTRGFSPFVHIMPGMSFYVPAPDDSGFFTNFFLKETREMAKEKNLIFENLNN